jgi:Rrf2 family transcriptional regulator, nitric oxide-sensitive transcriptional repressor
VRLTKHTDYALRVLMQIGLGDGELVRIADIANSYGISHNHLMKVVHRLGTRGYLETVQGRNGGLRLARKPAAIRVGDVVRDFEEDMALVECLGVAESACRIQNACVLKRALRDALEIFLDSLDQVTLADLLKPRRELTGLLAFGHLDRARRPAPAK